LWQVAIFSVALSSFATVRTLRIQDRMERDRQQGRIYSILEVQFMSRHLAAGEDEREYAEVSTLFRLAEYLGWMEILRRDVQFLDLGDQERNRELASMLQRISLAFANTHQYPNSAFRLFRDEQRAIGELAIELLPGDSLKYRCIGYAQFARLLHEDPAFGRWFARLQEEIQQMLAPPPLPGSPKRDQ
jgi:hypothetical protein